MSWEFEIKSGHILEAFQWPSPLVLQTTYLASSFHTLLVMNGCSQFSVHSFLPHAMYLLAFCFVSHQAPCPGTSMPPWAPMQVLPLPFLPWDYQPVGLSRVWISTLRVLDIIAHPLCSADIRCPCVVSLPLSNGFCLSALSFKNLFHIIGWLILLGSPFCAPFQSNTTFVVRHKTIPIFE